MNITEGALYPTLHKLEAKRILEMAIYNNRQRKYYSLTEKGSLEKTKRLEELEIFLAIMQNFLTPKPIL